MTVDKSTTKTTDIPSVEPAGRPKTTW